MVKLLSGASTNKITAGWSSEKPEVTEILEGIGEIIRKDLVQESTLELQRRGLHPGERHLSLGENHWKNSARRDLSEGQYRAAGPTTVVRWTVFVSTRSGVAPCAFAKCRVSCSSDSAHLATIATESTLSFLSKPSVSFKAYLPGLVY